MLGGRKRGALLRLLSRGVVTLVDQGIVSVTNFLTGVIVARSCSRAELGVYALAFGLLLMAITVQSSLVSLPYTLNSAKMAEPDGRAFAGSTVVHQLCLAAGAVVVLFSAALVTHGWNQTGVSPVLLVLAACVPFVLAREYLRQVFFTRLWFQSALALDAGASVAQLGLLIALARYGLLSARTAYCAMAIACAGAVGICAAFTWRSFAWSRRRFWPDFALNWSIGKWSLASGVLNLAGAQFFPWLVAVTRGVDDAGVLAACMGVAYLANPAIMGVGNFLAPQAIRAFATSVAAGRAVLRVGTFSLGGVMAVVSPGMLLAGGMLLRLIYGEHYAPFGLVVGLLSVAQALDVMAMPANCGLLVFAKPAVIVKGNVIVLLVAVGAGPSVVRALGPFGVGLTLAAGNALSLAYRWLEYRRSMCAGEVSTLPTPAQPGLP